MTSSQSFGRSVARQAEFTDRHGNVTIFLRDRHLFVTPGCNRLRKPKQQNHETSAIIHRCSEARGYAE
jgi:hypothetical protein